MQGNCTDTAPTFKPPSGEAPLRPLLPGQCLLLTNIELQAEANLWLDGLYFRITTHTTLFRYIGTVQGAELWLTRVTLQGNGDGFHNMTALQLAQRSSAYVEGEVIFLYSVAACMQIFPLASLAVLGIYFELSPIARRNAPETWNILT